MSQDEKIFLNMAGEFAVASELNRRQVLASVTYGSPKVPTFLQLTERRLGSFALRSRQPDCENGPLGRRRQT